MKKEKKLIKSASDMNLTSLKDTKKPKKKWKKATTPKSGFKRNLTSKLTNLMEKSLNHDIEDPETKNTSISSDDGFAYNSQMLHLTIFLVIGNVAQPISFFISNTSVLSLIIAKAINEFNTQFASDRTLFKLNGDASRYALKPSKKTGFPKTDMPFVNSSRTLADVNMTQFTLVWKENSADFRSYFIKSKVQEKKTCQGCIVF